MRYPTACGRTVTVPGGLAPHMRAHPVRGEHLAEAISTIVLPARGTLKVDVDLGRTVGLSLRVDAPPPDGGMTVLASVRKGRRHPSRVVVDAEPVPTSSVALVTRSDGNGTHLVTAFYGTSALPEVHDRMSGFDLEAAIGFWSGQALVWCKDGYVGTPFETTLERMHDGRWISDSRSRKIRSPGFAGP